MSLEDLRDAVVNTIKSGLGPGIGCEPHGGRFDVAELKRVSKKAPAVFVAFLGFRNLTYANDGKFQANVAWGAFVVAKDKRNLRRDLVAAAVVDRLTLIVPGNTWGTDDCLGRPDNVRGDNLFSSVVDNLGVAMWAVTWQQSMAFAEAMTPEDMAALDPLENLYVRYPVGDDAPEAVDRVNLPPIGD
jgi:phage gp37-like protein